MMYAAIAGVVDQVVLGCVVTSHTLYVFMVIVYMVWCANETYYALYSGVCVCYNTLLPMSMSNGFQCYFIPHCGYQCIIQV